MNAFVIFATLLASSFAAPALYLDTNLHTPSKSTITENSHHINHGGTTIYHAAIPVHTVHSPSKSTITENSHHISHGSTTIYHAPVHTVHTVPLHYEVSSPSKTTITKNSQVVNHGGHEIHSIPVIHHQPVHTYIHEPVHITHVASHVIPVKTKTTVTKNSQEINHGNTQHGSEGTGFTGHHELATSSQYFKLDSEPHVVTKVSRSGDSAVSHQSSTVHETVSEIKHLPLYAIHH